MSISTARSAEKFLCLSGGGDAAAISILYLSFWRRPPLYIGICRSALCRGDTLGSVIWRISRLNTTVPSGRRPALSLVSLKKHTSRGIHTAESEPKLWANRRNRSGSGVPDSTVIRIP
jgi:hypothetical protein